MKWVEARIIFESDDMIAASDLISEIFYDFGLQGVIIESPEVETGIDWAEHHTTLPADNAVIGYFSKNDQLPERCRMLEHQLTRLKQNIDMTYQIVYHNIDEQDWAESWKQYFFTEKITDTIVIKPSWREYTPKPDEIILEIDPGMAFGTGTHPTTRMCIALIEKYIQPKDSFLDIGTGSGILMIAAARLGAAMMTGIDNDEAAVSIAGHNLLKNNIPPGKCNIQTGDLVSNVSGQFSLVTANILSEIIVHLLDGIHPVLKKSGIFICSGIIEPKRAMVEEKLLARGFEIIDVQIKEEWVAIASKLK
ncbi:MAG: 50S ribosomal protein L11 methyltransferase [Desulfobacteraceae bacterium]|nr:50S ribosomal protein L11 methyltransferase [Desulfobacteraceae bacterium]MBC2755101.1 50S ribosomal protein L11 methyltransferase [Desulfobacteraceae bacterium]